jgi:hypothetical protein
VLDALRETLLLKESMSSNLLHASKRPDSEPLLIDVLNLSDRSGVPVASLRSMTKAGEIPHKKFGSTVRYLWSAVRPKLEGMMQQEASA